MTDLSKLEGGPLHHNPDGQTPPAPIVPGHVVAAQQEEEVRQEGHAPAATQIPAATLPHHVYTLHALWRCFPCQQQASAPAAKQLYGLTMCNILLRLLHSARLVLPCFPSLSFAVALGTVSVLCFTCR